MTTESLSVTIEGEVIAVEIGTVAVAAGGGSGSGDVAGPASATDDRIAAFDGTTGKLIKQGGVTATAVASHVGSTSNPHSVTAAQVGADAAGTASAAVVAHAIALDPHGDRAYADGLAVNYQPVAAVLTNTTASFTTAQETKLSGIEAAADVTDAGNVGTAIDGATAKTTPADADAVPLIDSAAANVLKKLSWTNIKATLKTYFDAIYQAVLVSGTNIKTVNSTSLLGSGDIAISATPGGSSGQFQYNDASAFGAANLWWISANTLAQRNSTTAQTLRINDTYTDDSNQAYLELNAGAAGDWFQICAVTVGTAADNYGVAVSPSGTGALSAHVPDSTSAGGNARGANAIDWQTSRTAATHVASQLYSTISGGRSNTASGQYATVAGGNFSAASNDRATVGGGEFNVASGAFSTIAGGYLCTASGSFSVAGGHSSTTRGLQGAVSHSSSPRSAVGDAQVISQPVRRTTTDATPVSLSANGSAPTGSTAMVLPANSTLMVTAMVGARDSSGNSAGWIAQALFKRDGSSNTSRLGSATVTAIGTPDAAVNTATIDLVANDTIEAAEIQVTGVAATTIYWVGNLKCIQIA